MSTEIAELKGERLTNWWYGFRCRGRLTIKKVSSYRHVDDEVMAPLLKNCSCPNISSCLCPFSSRVEPFSLCTHQILLCARVLCRANIRRSLRDRRYQWIGSGDETSLSLEPIAKTTLEAKGVKKSVVRIG